jgi:glycosyltransferase involved in cell wall biosynthesis
LETVGSRLLLSVNTAEFFLSHRLHLAEGARAQGWDVWVLCPDGPLVSKIREKKFSVVTVPLGRKSMGLFCEVKTLIAMGKAIREVKPKVYHGFTIKNVLYGTLLCRLLGVPQIVNTITGLGFFFISQKPLIRYLRFFVGWGYRLLFASSKVQVIFQNEDDLQMFVERKWVQPHQTTVIKGTGVDLQIFYPRPEPPGAISILFPARLLKDKGILETLRAAELLKEKGYDFNLQICGNLDPGNPSSMTEAELSPWRSLDYIKINGHVHNMSEALSKCHIVCLPSYREGIPLALIEACAAGKPIVTTNVPGCRAVVTEGQEGFLVPRQNPEALALALENLLQSKELRGRMAQQARTTAEFEFAKEPVVAQNLAVYTQKNISKNKIKAA